jgi:hypothetical protein
MAETATFGRYAEIPYDEMTPDNSFPAPLSKAATVHQAERAHARIHLDDSASHLDLN